ATALAVLDGCGVEPLLRHGIGRRRPVSIDALIRHVLALFGPGRQLPLQPLLTTQPEDGSGPGQRDLRLHGCGAAGAFLEQGIFEPDEVGHEEEAGADAQEDLYEKRPPHAATLSR